jgi:hypothetical protein
MNERVISFGFTMVCVGLREILVRGALIHFVQKHELPP